MKEDTMPTAATDQMVEAFAETLKCYRQRLSPIVSALNAGHSELVRECVGLIIADMTEEINTLDRSGPRYRHTWKGGEKIW